MISYKDKRSPTPSEYVAKIGLRFKVHILLIPKERVIKRVKRVIKLSPLDGKRKGWRTRVTWSSILKKDFSPVN